MDIIKKGQKFNKWIVIKEIKSNDYHRKALCQCECGNIKEIRYQNIKHGKSKSCLSCACKKSNNGFKITHGMRKTRFYHIWCGIKERCNNKNKSNYKRYGGCGITICKEWLKFENFRDDMYSNYQEHYKKFGEKNTFVDRINNNGNYELSNCKWSTLKEQANNKSNSHWLTYNSKTQTIAQWSEELNINYKMLLARINRYNWSTKRALTK